MINVLLLIVTGLLLLYTSITDIKSRDVYNWAPITAIIIGLGLRLVESFLKGSFWAFAYGLLGFIVIGGLGCLLYYMKLWGGGDALLLMALGSLLGFNITFLIVFCATGVWFLLLAFLLKKFGFKLTEMPFVPVIAVATGLFLFAIKGKIC
jgi:Flp pilus assembly protein protease CpaA